MEKTSRDYLIYDPPTLQRTLDKVEAGPVDDCFRLKASYRDRRKKSQLQYAYTKGYPTREAAVAEAGIFGYAVLKDLAQHWIPFNKRGSHSDTSRFDQYFTDFELAKSSGSTPACKRSVSAAKMPLNAAQTSEFKKLKKSSCSTLSKNEYLQAATSSNDVYDRFVRKLRRFRNTGFNFNKTESNRRAYLKRRELTLTELVAGECS